MRFVGALGLLLALTVPAAPQTTQPSKETMLRRLAEEASLFYSQARYLVAQETLEQRSAVPPKRFQPRIGEDALRAAELEYEDRTIQSEYGYGSFKESPNVLHEFRQVVSVDGKPVKGSEKAREKLSLGLTSHDDRIRKRMLETFEKHGLRGAVTDFGQIILLFGKSRLSKMDFTFKGESFAGADKVFVYDFTESESASLTVFEGKKAKRRYLSGEIFVRQTDYLPLRVTVKTEREFDGKAGLMSAAVDYEQSRFGVLVPIAVHHRETVGEDLLTENKFSYTEFRRFGSESDLKFEIEDPAPKP